jgi:putative toxin-antitoxin system antitoxin component (TIGR02293 family)
MNTTMRTHLDEVIEVMGGKEVVPHIVNNSLDWIRVSKDLSIRAVRALQDRMNFTNKEVSRFIAISESTLQRRLKEQTVLTTDEAEKTIQVATVIAQGISVFEDEDDFRDWLHIKNPALGNIKPIELMHSSIGREQIMDLLNRIEYSIYS